MNRHDQEFVDTAASVGCTVVLLVGAASAIYTAVMLMIALTMWVF